MIKPQKIMALLLSLLLPVAVTQLQAAPKPDDHITLKVFAGSKSTRPDLLRQILDDYQRQHPVLRVEISIGGATSELQRKYLSTLLNAQDSTFDVFLIDIVNPAQYAAAGWIEPLGAYLNEGVTALFKDYLPVYKEADWVHGRLVALPSTSDALFMYYRKDLLDKYQLAEPDSWQTLAAVAKHILQQEQSTHLKGLSIQGAPIEGTVCSFLMPYWSQGKALTDEQGGLTLDKTAALNSFNLWLDLIKQGVLKKNVAEIKTNDTLNDFKAGNLLFAINWGFAWDKFQNDADSKVSGKVGVMRLPGLADGATQNGSRSTCIGGGQWAVSAFSRHKREAAALVHYLASPAVSKFFALKGGLLPTRSALYEDADILARMPWLTLAKPVMLNAKSRPVSPRYSEISNTLRSTTSAVLGGSVSPEDGVQDIEQRLTRILR